MMGCICSRLISSTSGFKVLEEHFTIQSKEITRTEEQIIKKKLSQNSDYLCILDQSLEKEGVESKENESKSGLKNPKDLSVVQGTDDKNTDEETRKKKLSQNSDSGIILDQSSEKECNESNYIHFKSGLKKHKNLSTGQSKDDTNTDEEIRKKKLSQNSDSGIVLDQPSGKESNDSNYIDFKSSSSLPEYQSDDDTSMDIQIKKDCTNEMTNKDYGIQVLSNTSCLPRYIYHRSLIEWISEGLPDDPTFQGYPFEDCSIIIGGNMTEENKARLVGESALIEKVAITELQKVTLKLKHPEVLILDVMKDDVYEEIREMSQWDIFENGTVLFVMTSDNLRDEKLKSNLLEKVSEFKSCFQVEFVTDNRSEIIKRMTLILEQRLRKYLEETKTKLHNYSLTHYVGSRLLEVNAILRRLKQAACYPKLLTDEIEEDKPERNEIDEILERFHDNILNTGYFDNTLHVITADQSTKDSLEALFSALRNQNISLAITVTDKLPISKLSKIGVPLHGAKFVLVDEGVDAFHSNKTYATTGSLMKVANSNMMVAIICRHAVENKGSTDSTCTCYTIIENTVVKLGQTLPQSSGQMKSLHDDIAVVRIDEKTRSLIDEKCEKLLIDKFELPTPATIAMTSLKRGDIVHKRGARSGLTTGVVKDVKTEKIGSFVIPSRTIYITGGDSEPFAKKGDSGSLVFQHSLDPETNVLNVNAMVQSKVQLPIPNADIICFPFNEGFESLRKSVTDEDLQNLQFFSV